MATAYAYTPFNADTFSLSEEGTITTATPNYVQLVLGAQMQELFGANFQFNQEGDIIGGTLAQTKYWISGTLQYDFSDLNISMLTVEDFFDRYLAGTATISPAAERETIR
jgi:hypothetical protein